MRNGLILRAAIALASAVCLAACVPANNPKQTSVTFNHSDQPLIAPNASAVERAVSAATAIQRVPPDLSPSLLDASSSGWNLASGSCYGKGTDIGPGECDYGDLKSHRLAVLLGDSHAGMWFPGLSSAALFAGWRLKAFIRAACPALALSFYSPQDHTPDLECTKFHASAVAMIAKLKPDLVVVSSSTLSRVITPGRNATADEWTTGLATMLSDLGKSGAKLLVLGDIPAPDQSPPECLAAHESSVKACTTSADEALKNLYRDSESKAATESGARYVDVTPWLCNSQTCPPIVKNLCVYRNQFHITATYSEYLSKVLAKAVFTP